MGVGASDRGYEVAVAMITTTLVASVARNRYKGLRLAARGLRKEFFRRAESSSLSPFALIDSMN